jgi:hypothetical protein
MWSKGKQQSRSIEGRELELEGITSLMNLNRVVLY